MTIPAPVQERLGTVHPGAWGDAAWEESKAARRPLSHHEAVQETRFLQKQYRELWSGRMARSPVDVNQVVRTLTAKRIPFVLTGAHGIGAWMGRPRSTQDVDILVKGGRNLSRAVKALRELYPTLEVRSFVAVTRFYVPGEAEPVLDVVFPQRPDQEETLAHPVWVEEEGLRYRVPSLEAALANKYGAMLSTSRSVGKRGQDVLDFYWMVTHSQDPGRKPINLEKLRSLGELIWPDGGGAEILRLVAEAREDKVPRIDPPQSQ